MPVDYTDTELTVDGMTIGVSQPITTVLETGDAILVVLDPPPDVDDPQPVLAFGRSGTQQ